MEINKEKLESEHKEKIFEAETKREVALKDHELNLEKIKNKHTEEMKKIISLADESIFLEDDIRFLSFSEILNANIEYAVSKTKNNTVSFSSFTQEVISEGTKKIIYSSDKVDGKTIPTGFNYTSNNVKAKASLVTPIKVVKVLINFSPT